MTMTTHDAAMLRIKKDLASKPKEVLVDKLITYIEHTLELQAAIERLRKEQDDDQPESSRAFVAATTDEPECE